MILKLSRNREYFIRFLHPIIATATRSSLFSGIDRAISKRLGAERGKRFKRFALAAVLALVSSQVTLTVCLGVLHFSGGVSGFAAWAAGAATSYIMSRWAWERKGRPDFLRETLPFWLIAVCVAIILTSVARFSNDFALLMNFNHVQRVLFVDASYFLANCITFLSRFIIFHYVLFTDKKLRMPSPN